MKTKMKKPRKGVRGASSVPQGEQWRLGGTATRIGLMVAAYGKMTAFSSPQGMRIRRRSS